MEGVLAFARRSLSLASSTGTRHSPPKLLPSRGPAPVPRSSIRFQNSACFRRRRRVRCRSSSGGGSSPAPDPGENDSKAALDAFFLGKALAEAINERIGSNVGEFLSVIGQWQAEQQKQVLDFQEEVMQRAKKAKEKASAEALAAEGSGLSTSSRASSAPAIGRPVSASNEDDPMEEMLNG
ncbi:unnamed protein product [Spirodela intermedia]|uniref:Uncharacterized protein n=2 Tax=Spirodela intermedia TaxID=51605 RepID=A0A7I8KZM8_SPIIN|nr:unnamed protein product [Spirodela intermedia]CAA6666466.1 unnamed protein product [Spirodela intermedia]CAA7403259.1 unnamed protein product [Spirodela intermedia]